MGTSFRARLCFALAGWVVATAAWAACVGTACGGDSGGYRGPGRNGVFEERGLMGEWPEGGPMLVWRYGNLGNSWSAVLVSGETVYAVGGGSVGRLFAFTLDGRLKWRQRYGGEFSVRYQGCRSTPTVSGGMVVVASGQGVVYGMDAETGEAAWSVDTRERFGNKVPGWGYNITPLVVDGKAIVPIRRGTCTMAALDVGTGETVWANEASEYAIGDSSPVLVEARGRRLVVANLWHALVAVDPETGRTVWKREGKDAAGTAMTPVFSEGYLLVDYGGKTVMLRPTADGRGFEELWSGPRLNSIGQAVIVDGKVFGFGGAELECEEGEGEAKGEARARKRRGNAYLCYDAATGRLLKAVAARGAPGSVVAADGHVYWQESGPRLSLARVTREGFEMVSTFEPEVGGEEVWIHPVIAGGRLYVRSDCAQGGDQAKSAGKLAVYDLRASGAAALRARRARIGELEAALGSGDAEARASSAGELAGMGWEARPAVGSLAKALSDGEERVRRSAASALAAIGPEAIPGLIEALGREDVWSEGLGAEALVKATPGAASVGDALVEAAEATMSLREAAGALLAKVEPEAVVPRLAGLLVSGDRRVRWWAIEVLRGYGAASRSAAPELVHVLETGNQWFRANAARTLGAIGPDAGAAVPALVRLLKDEDADARAAAAGALGAIGSKGPEVLAGLRAAAGDADESVASAARGALERLGK